MLYMQVLVTLVLRIRAGKEFTFETFKEGIDYAHARGKNMQQLMVSI